MASAARLQAAFIAFVVFATFGCGAEHQRSSRIPVSLGALDPPSPVEIELEDAPDVTAVTAFKDEETKNLVVVLVCQGDTLHFVVARPEEEDYECVAMALLDENDELLFEYSEARNTIIDGRVTIWEQTPDDSLHIQVYPIEDGQLELYTFNGSTQRFRKMDEDEEYERVDAQGDGLSPYAGSCTTANGGFWNFYPGTSTLDGNVYGRIMFKLIVNKEFLHFLADGLPASPEVEDLHDRIDLETPLSPICTAIGAASLLKCTTLPICGPLLPNVGCPAIGLASLICFIVELAGELDYDYSNFPFTPHGPQP